MKYQEKQSPGLKKITLEQLSLHEHCLMLGISFPHGLILLPVMLHPALAAVFLTTLIKVSSLPHSFHSQ